MSGQSFLSKNVCYDNLDCMVDSIMLETQEKLGVVMLAMYDIKKYFFLNFYLFNFFSID